MSPGGEQSTRRRSSNACLRCRRHKIKCSGRVPCDACKRRRVDCDYEVDEPKVFVSKRYLSELKAKAALLESHQQVPSPGMSGEGPLQDPTPLSLGPSDNTTQITNPVFSPDFQTHASGSQGVPYFMGHSSNYSFTQRVLRLLHAHSSDDPYPYSSYMPTGSSDLGWEGLRSTVDCDIDTLPSLDHAIFLLNAVKFHAGQIYHLFDEASFMAQLYQFYTDPAENMTRMNIWYIHFLVLLAFGKAFVVSDAQSGRPPGSEYFVQAARLLPETTYLMRDFISATEILCCMALYYQALDARASAYDKIGQAVRLGIGSGMHTQMKSDTLDPVLIQRCRKAWWTIVVIDRQISCLMGLPIQVRDEDITAPLPVFADSEQRTSAMKIQVGLSRALSQVVDTVYRKGSKSNINFITSTQDALRNVASVSAELRTHFALPATGSLSGISPVAAHLNILYHHCIVVATRPFLYLYIEKRIKSSENTVASLFSKDPIRHILKIGLGSAKRISMILFALKDQHLIESFLAFELETAFSAGTFISIGEANFPALFKNDGPSLAAIIDSLQIMMGKGNLAARSRLIELDALTRMLEEMKESNHDQQQHQSGQEGASGEAEGSLEMVPEEDMEMTPAGEPSESHGFDANSINLSDWLEGADASDLYSPSHHLQTIAESLDTWDLAGWLSTLAYDA